jgi:hypothetical protein
MLYTSNGYCLWGNLPMWISLFRYSWRGWLWRLAVAAVLVGALSLAIARSAASA